MRKFLSITKALSDENRVRALMFLREQELCVCQIIEMLHLAPSTVSKHMSVLKAAELVDSRKEGRWIYYRRAAKADTPIAKALDWLDASLSEEPTVLQDAKYLACVRKKSLGELCAHYKD